MDNPSVKKIKKEYVIAALLFIAVIAVAFVSFGKNDATGGLSETEIYVGRIESKLEKAISGIDGVKKVRVVVSVDGAVEKVYQKDEKSISENGKTTITASTVFSGGKPIEIGEKYPGISGVLVVCKGADDLSVRMNVLDAVTAVTDIPCDKIRILPQ